MWHQPSNSEHVRRRLLAMLATEQQSGPSTEADSDRAEWLQLQRMVGQHRLKPLLHDLNRHRCGTWNIPPEIKASWETAFRDSAMESLAIQHTLFRVTGKLEDAITLSAQRAGTVVSINVKPGQRVEPSVALLNLAQARL